MLFYNLLTKFGFLRAFEHRVGYPINIVVEFVRYVLHCLLRKHILGSLRIRYWIEWVLHVDILFL